MIRRSFFYSFLTTGVLTTAASAQEGTDFVAVDAILQKHCLECHNEVDADADLDFENEGSEAHFRADAVLLENMIWSLEENEMPPKKAKLPLPAEDREVVVKWLKGALFELQNSRPNDPGRVVVPRLNHHQYQRVIEDITKLPIDTKAVYPVSGGGTSGFPNEGQSQTAGALEAEKFLLAAKFVMSHAVITPGVGVGWVLEKPGDAKSPEALREELTKQWEFLLTRHAQRMFDKGYGGYAKLVPELEKKLNQNDGAFLEAAWRYEHRAALGFPKATLEDFAANYEVPLPAPVLRRWHSLLTETKEDRGPYLDRLAAGWRALPRPQRGELTLVRRETRRLIDDLALDARSRDLKEQANGRFENAQKLGRPVYQKVLDDYRKNGTYTVVLHRAQMKDKAGRFFLVVSPADGASEHDFVVVKGAKAVDGGRNASFDPAGLRIVSGRAKPEAGGLLVQAPAVLEGVIPEGIKVLQFQVAPEPKLGKEGAVQVGLYDEAPPENVAELRGRAIVGFPDAGAVQVLKRGAKLADDALRSMPRGLTNLKAPKRAGNGDRLRPVTSNPSPWLEPRSLTVDELVSTMEPGERDRLQMIERLLADSFKDYSAGDMATRGRRIIDGFAALALRGSATREDLEPLYRMLDEHLEAGDGFDASVRLPLTALLVHPKFLYQIQQTRGTERSYPLGGNELAARLSFAIWGSVPDQELLDLADSGRLTEPRTLALQALRLMRDPRGRRLAEDFAGYWLHYEGFQEHGGVDRERFPAFSNELRDAMYEEVVTFVDQIIRGEAPVTDLIDADYVYVNEALAKHYGIPGVKGSEIRKVELPEGSPRGGVLGMGALLTKTSKPLRTSPVVRGDWILQEVIGISMPAPPDNVPLLSDEDTNKEGLTFLEQLEVHRKDPACSSCHDRLDPLGIALENFDPIGGWREKDSAGNKVISSSPLPNGGTLDGIDGLKKFISDREDQVIEHMVEKFTAYMLGRPLLATDRALVESMIKELRQRDDRFPVVLVALVQSEQFRMRRDALRE